MPPLLEADHDAAPAQRDAGRIGDAASDLEDESVHVVGGGPRLGLEEVGVLGRDDRATHPEPLEAGGVDDPPRRVALRVREHRAGVGPPGLVGPPPGHDLVDLGRGLLDRPGRDDELGAGHDVEGAEGRSAVPELQLGGGQRPCGPAGTQVDDERAAEHGRGVPSVSPRVHAHRAADAAGDPDEELEPTDAGGGRDPRPASAAPPRHLP